ncbi:type VII secretion protein EccB [Rugosimonospora acidiphila]|uniref:Type VII secretion protein EccB n=1 Tax=Rugosimonospora acidiphila TaxID=556531 RepID=A0ABP9RQY1_9ACTN
MPSRREQIQSYQYLMQRVVNAFVAGQTDPPLSPMRRMAGAGFASVMIAALIVAVVGVVGLVKHGGNTSWRDQRAVIIEKETGTRYIYRDDTLYPVANYVSALLALGGSESTVAVSRESLVGVARGPLIGIVGAPDALPPAGRILGAPWSVCAQPDVDSSGASTATSWLWAGRAPQDATHLGQDGLVVRLRTGDTTYLVWNGHRFPIDKRTLGALGADQAPQLVVDEAWLDAVPQGQSITPIGLADRGRPSTAVRGALIGQIYAATGGGTTQYYLVRPGDLLPLTAVEEQAELANPATADAYPGATPTVRQVNPAEIAGVRKASRPARTDETAPAQVPNLARPDTGSAVCAEYRDGTSTPELVYDAGSAPVGGITTGGSETAAVVDRVVVPPGYGAVVRSVSSADSGVGTLFLVTDEGKRYPVPDAQQLSWLGYGSVKPLDLPSWLVSRIPGGPSLDPADAALPVSGS